MTLTPALSHPMGEGESFAGFWNVRSAEIFRTIFRANVEEAGIAMSDAEPPGRVAFCSLSHRMGEGQGEGFFDSRLLKVHGLS